MTPTEQQYKRPMIQTEAPEKEREKREVPQNLGAVSKIVKQFSRPATFKSIKIDLFVMRGDPFGIPRA